MKSVGYSWIVYKRFLSRLLILYLFWFIVTLPFTVYSKLNYLDYGFPMIIVHVIKDFLFSYTFAGSWFLTALMVGTAVIFMMKRYLRVSNVILLVLVIMTYLYLEYATTLPEWLQQPYKFIQHYVREEVELTPVRGFIWCGVGTLLAGTDLIKSCSDAWGLRKSIMFALAIWIMAICVISVHPVYILVRCLFVLSTIVVAYGVQVASSGLYLQLRNLSILIYLIHFPLLVILGHYLSSKCTHFVYFMVVLLAALLIAMLILKLENSKYFRLLKYSH